jgi:hypothetical protein
MTEIQLGPPYTNFRMVRNFLPPGDGLWSVAKFTPSTGGLVLQAGANAGMVQPEGIGVSAGYERDITVSAAGLYLFKFLVAIGPVSLLPRGDLGNQNLLDAAVQVSLKDVPNAFAEFSVHAGTGSGFVGRNYGTLMFSFSASLKKNASYTLQLYQFLSFDYSPFVPSNAPYAEIIATYQQTVEVMPTTAAREETRNFAKILSRTKREVVEATDEEMARAGTFELK